MHARPSPARLSANEEIVAHSLGEVRSFLDELKHGTKKYKTIASLSGQIAEAYRGRCVLELLQNAHDALADSPDGDPRLITFLLETEPAPVASDRQQRSRVGTEGFQGALPARPEPEGSEQERR